MYNRKFWQDHVTQYTNRFNETTNPDGTKNLIPVEGQIIQEGTPQNALNFNNIETGILSGNEQAAELTRITLQQGRTIKGIVGEVGSTILTNTLVYPFNNSIKTVSLAQKRDTADYTVDVDASATVGGSIGRIVITDKLVNGFKIAFTGGATSVNVKYIIWGGIL